MMSLYFSIYALTLSCSVPVEGKPLYAGGHVSGHANPAFLLKTQDSDHLVMKSTDSAVILYCF